MYKDVKQINFILGLLFLIPPFISLFSFSSCIMSDGYPSHFFEHFVQMSNLRGEWSGDGMSPAPIYLGLMAIAGAVLLHSAAEKDESDLKETKK